jgi:hypothetical protein
VAEHSTDVVSALWERVLASWDDDAVHEVFIDQCASAGQLPYAAERYREHGDAADGDDTAAVQEEVERRLAMIQAKALATLQLERQPAKPRVGCRVAMTVVSVVLLLATLMLLGQIVR